MNERLTVLFLKELAMFDNGSSNNPFMSEAHCFWVTCCWLFCYCEIVPEVWVFNRTVIMKMVALQFMMYCSLVDVNHPLW